MGDCNEIEVDSLRILVLSNTPWAMDNSFGNSFSNIFGGMDDVEIANIYCRYGEPNNNIVGKYFQITEKSLLKNLINKNYPSGKVVFNHNQSDVLNSLENTLFDRARKQRFQIYFWARDFIWKIGRWKSPELVSFINEFKPDIIFQPLYYSTYLNEIALFIKKYTSVPMVCYVSDDVYTMKQFSLSPLFWIDRFIKRRKIKKVVDQCEHLYVISDVQMQDYEKCFKKECRVLTKGADFSTLLFKETTSSLLKLVYTGNIGGGRWKSLASIGKQLKKINKKKIKMQLFIYSMTPMTNRMSKARNIENSGVFMGGVPADKVPGIQADADILVHIEPTDIKGRLQVHHSFSTKLIDYFHAGRCIFAVGTLDMASINYLIKNEAGIVATNEDEIYTKMIEIINDTSLLKKYAQNAWECGKRNHQIDDVQRNLYQDLKSLVKDEKQ